MNNLAAAERRVEDALRTRLEHLDLGDLALERLPTRLRELTHLRVLALGCLRLRDDGTFEWDSDRQPPSFSDLSALAGLQGLQSLNLSYCGGVTDLSALAGLQGLQRVDLSYCGGVTDLSVLAGLQGLQSLNLSFCKGVTDLSVLAGLPGLQSLYLSGCEGVTDLSVLAGLPGLQSLYLSGCEGVTDLSVLAGLPGLQSLDLSGCEGVTDLSVLAGLQGLQSLNLSGCEGVTDLSVLAGLQGLQSLYLSGCAGVTDLSVLAGLQGLQSLNLSSCAGVTDLSVLAGLQGLQSLNLSFCKGVTDLSVLAGLPGLQSLYLSGCEGVTDLSVLAGLPGLQSLYLSGCEGVTDLSVLAGLPGLQSLDLSGCEGVTDLSVLAGLQGLQSLNLSGCEGVTDLSVLAGLQGLQSLYLSGCAGVTDLSVLAGLQGLQSLNLSSCAGVTDLSVLAGLQGLQSLNLSFCKGVTDLSVLAGLQGLQSLDLSYCRGVTDLPGLAGLQGLQNLDLSFCRGVTDLSVLAGLQGLQSLDLSYCRGVTDLSALAGLQGLQSLNLSSCPGVADLSALAGLQGVQSLNLSGCEGVTDLSALAGLQGVQSLNLSGCEGVTDLSALAGLQGLQSLNLRNCKGVTDLSGLAGLQGLQNLNLSSCPGLMDLSALAGLQGLQSLDFSDRQGVTDLSALAGLQGLQSLNLSDCLAVTDLSALAGLQGLRSLNLYSCRPPIENTVLRNLVASPRLASLICDEGESMPREVLSHESDEDCLPRLRSFFAEIDRGAEAEREVKVILLGNGCVGKTQLCRRFRDQPFDEAIGSTHGVQIWRDELRLPSRGEPENAFQVNWWDFGGQDIYHGTHALFLRSRAVFLLLWTPQLENRDEYTEQGIPLRNQPLAYWLDYVRTLAGDGSPVIVVQSKCDTFKHELSAPNRPEGLEFFRCCAYSAVTDFGREVLEVQLREAVRFQLEKTGSLAIGHARAEVRRRLYQMRSEDQEQRPEDRRHRTLTLDEFRSLCEEVGGIASWEHALDYFHHTGVVFYRPDLFSNRILLDQDWALEAIYTVFHRGRAARWLRDSGRFSREDLSMMAWQQHSVEEQKLFLGLMESCGVCFACGTASLGETIYAAPDLLPLFSAVQGRLFGWKDDPQAPSLWLEYQFFHPAVIRGLMSAIGRQAGEAAEYWKYGFRLWDRKRDAQILIQQHDTSTNETPGQGALELTAQGRDALGLLRGIWKEIRQRQIGEPPEEFLSLEGVTVSRSAMANAMEGQTHATDGRVVPVAPFAAFFEDREPEATGGRRPTELRLDFDPGIPPAGEKLPEVFISYAWGDDSMEGRVRTEVVERLCAALKMDGFAPVRDREALRPGELISAFMKQAARANHVVAVISDKYLRSPYCMFEIHRIYQQCEAEAERLARRVLPIVLPDVRLATFEERAPYLRLWSRREKTLGKLIRDPELHPSEASWTEYRLVHDFAHHVDSILGFIQDVLMPRRLEVQLENGFEAVREALRRRIARDGA